MMPLFPYRLEEPVRATLSPEVCETLEHWVNYGVGETAEYDLDTFWYPLLCGDYLGAARMGSSRQLTAMGWILAELAENAPASCFGSPEKVRSWRGLVEDDPTLLSEENP